uniref:glutamyl-tRNA(Gln) amidotransferase subunit C, mitochondrial-like n=1 Tax=Styela clava TaxID=7725 RepID=UPI00193ACB29|nr:glutamyl-tRNA(Gln) amidotransferase subunit C, mitochondrial-like [Styela clava]
MLTKKSLSALRRIHSNTKICTSKRNVLKKASDLIPKEPVWKHIEEVDLPPPTKISLSKARHLEQLSLVNFEDTNAVKRLESAIRFADQILHVDTDGVEPLVSVLENVPLPMRDDEPQETKGDVLKLPQEVFEGYYIAPVGNKVYEGETFFDIDNEKDDKLS